VFEPLNLADAEPDPIREAPWTDGESWALDGGHVLTRLVINDHEEWGVLGFDDDTSTAWPDWHWWVEVAHSDGLGYCMTGGATGDDPVMDFALREGLAPGQPFWVWCSIESVTYPATPDHGTEYDCFVNLDRIVPVPWDADRCAAAWEAFLWRRHYWTQLDHQGAEPLALVPLTLEVSRG